MEEKVFKNKLKESAEVIGVSLSDESLDKLYKYKDLVLEWNKVFISKKNIIKITDEQIRNFLERVK